MKQTCALLAVLFFGATTTACGSLSTDRCDQSCHCRDCGTREYDECILSADYDEDYYDAYGCDIEYEDYADCEIARARCVGDSYFVDPTDCTGEIARLNDCVHDSSSL
jgi:hypothetical protein